MPFTSGNVITMEDIINKFTSDVINVIKSGVIDINNVYTSPYYGRYIVNPAYLGNINTLPQIQSIGDRGSVIKAQNDGSYDSSITYGSLYNAMVYITRCLLKIGTFTYHESYGYNTGFINVFDVTGKAFFNDSAINSAKSTSGKNIQLNPNPPGNGDVKSGSAISCATINALIQNCFNAWKLGSKVDCTTLNYQCHDNCHQNCHDNCHSDCYDHVNETGYGSAAGGHGDKGCYCNGPWIYGELYDQGFRCHSDGDCHNDTGSPKGCHTDTVSITVKNGI